MGILLPTDFRDDLLQEGQTKRKYRMINNPDGTVSFDDVTQYQEVGSNFGASNINTTNAGINEINNKRLETVEEVQAVKEKGFTVDATLLKYVAGEAMNLVFKTFKPTFAYSKFGDIPNHNTKKEEKYLRQEGTYLQYNHICFVNMWVEGHAYVEIAPGFSPFYSLYYAYNLPVPAKENIFACYIDPPYRIGYPKITKDNKAIIITSKDNYEKEVPVLVRGNEYGDAGFFAKIIYPC